MIQHRFGRLLGAVLLLVPSLALGQTALQQPVTDRTKGTVDPIPSAITKLYQNDVFLQGLVATRFSALGAAALLNVGTVTGTVADGGALAAEIVRAKAAEQANAAAIQTNATAISTETSRAQGVEALKAPIASPALTGVPTAPTAALGTSNTQIANMAAVAAAVAAGGGGSSGVPTSRQILTSGLATGGGDLTADRTITVPAAAQSDVATGTDQTKALTSYSIAAALGAKAPLASPAFVGAPTAPTAAAGTNGTQIATAGLLTTSALRPDLAQSLTSAQKIQAKKNGSILGTGYAYIGSAASLVAGNVGGTYIVQAGVTLTLPQISTMQDGDSILVQGWGGNGAILAADPGDGSIISASAQPNAATLSLRNAQVALVFKYGPNWLVWGMGAHQDDVPSASVAQTFSAAQKAQLQANIGIGTGWSVNYSRGVSATMQTITAQTPISDTAPTTSNTTGVVSVSHTPKAAGNILHVRAVLSGSVNGQGTIVGALFQGSGTSAIAARASNQYAANFLTEVVVDAWVTAPSTSPITFSLAGGANNSNALTVNGVGGGRTFGGVMTSHIEVTETLP